MNKKKAYKKSGRYKEKFYYFYIRNREDPIIGSIIKDTIDIGGGSIFIRPYKKGKKDIIEIRKTEILAQRYDYYEKC